MSRDTYINIKTEDHKKKRLFCSSVGFNSHLQNIQAAPTTDRRDNSAKHPKWEGSFAIIATPSIIDSAKLATAISVVPMRFALDDGIPVWRIWAPTTSYDMCPNRDRICTQKQSSLCAKIQCEQIWQKLVSRQKSKVWNFHKMNKTLQFGTS